MDGRRDLSRRLGWTYLRSRLAFAFAALLVLKVVVGVVDLQQLDRVRSSGEAIQNVTLPKMSLLQQIEQGLASYHLRAQLLVHLSDRDTVSEIENTLATSTAAFTDLIDEFQRLPLSDEEREMVTALQSNWGQSQSDARAVVASGSTVAARGLFEQRLDTNAAAMNENIVRLREMVDMQAENFHWVALESYNAARSSEVISAFLGLLVAVLVMIWVRRNVSDPLLRTSAELLEIAEGDAAPLVSAQSSRPNEMAILREATERFGQSVAETREMAASLETQRSILDSTLRHMPVGLCLFSRRQNLSLANVVFREMFGLSVEVFPRRCSQSKVLNHILSKLEPGQERIDTILSLSPDQAASLPRVEGIFRLKNGKTIVIIIENTARGWMLITNDISDRVSAEAERDKTRERLEQALATSEDAFVILEADRTIVFANEANSVLFPAGEGAWQAGTNFDDNWTAFRDRQVNTEGDFDPLPEVVDFDALAASKEPIERVHPDGRHLLIRCEAFRDGSFVIGATNVTWLKKAQALLLQRLAAIEAAHEGIAIADDNGKLLYANSAAGYLLGFENPLLAVNHHWQTRYPDVEFPTGRDRYDLVVKREVEGAMMAQEITASPLETGGSVIVFRDVTERLETEAREATLRQALVRAQRQESVSHLAAGIAHDFNNLLSAINGSATLISMNNETTDSIKEHATRISAAGGQAAKLVNRLLDFGAHDGSSVFDIGTALSDFRSLVEPGLPRDITFDMEIDDEALLVRGDPGELSQAVLNLVMNASDAIGTDTGEIKLTIEHFETAEPVPVLSGVLSDDGQFARITVRDNGHGMSPEVMKKALEPYFTTKERVGTGLGLALASMQLTAIGGGVDIHSVEGEGTTVSLYWPCHSAEVGLDVRVGTDDGPDLNGMMILVIEDEIEVAEVLQTYLEAHGAEVAVSTSPIDAVEIVEEDPDIWSAIVTDYDMPGMTGGDVVERVRAVSPDMPVFLVTALARRLSDPRVASGRVRSVFSKPVNLDKLSWALSDIRAKQPETV